MLHFNHFPAEWAWAMDTPFQWTKQVASHLGLASSDQAERPDYTEPFAFEGTLEQVVVDLNN